MEVGAVKQAFNNEVILLKKKLNQAKIQIIHKLTRKAKTFTEKKVPEKLKVKFTKKAESAVKEVLIIKKIKARDIAKFIVTHKGELNGYLNRPAVDQDKACARLLLHKALQDKYKVIRERFSNISIKDLLMSRQERRKLKKEAREKQKNKKKGKDTNVPVQVEGDWDVEDIKMDDSQLITSDNDSGSSVDEHDSDAGKGDKNSESDDDNSASVVVKTNISSKHKTSNSDVGHSNVESNELNDEVESDNESRTSNGSEKEGSHSSESDNNRIEKSPSIFVKYNSCFPDDNIIVNKNSLHKKVPKIKEKGDKNKIETKCKDTNKNKNLMNKILLKKFNKENSQTQILENKIVDPFFITATGENYMSVAEPRPPDEVKEVHKQGNRKYRRAVMFGNIPRVKPRRDDFRPDTTNSKYSKLDDNIKRASFKNKYNGYEKNGPQKSFDKSVNSSNRGNFRNKIENKKHVETEPKHEKLHPSWEAKKRQSGILPFQGKKIVFDES